MIGFVSGTRILTSTGYLAVSALNAAFRYVSPFFKSHPKERGATFAAGASAASKAVASVTVGSGGSGYDTPPTVVFSGGGGSGAAGTAVLNTGAVASVTITSGGEGYTSAPTVTFVTADGDTGVTPATGTAVLTATGELGTRTITLDDNTQFKVSPATKVFAATHPKKNDGKWIAVSTIDNDMITAGVWLMTYHDVLSDLGSRATDAEPLEGQYDYRKVISTATDATGGGVASHSFAVPDTNAPTEFVINGGVVVKF